MKYLFGAIILFLTLSFIIPKSASAQYGCQSEYGGCAPSLTILMNKLVGKPVATKGGMTDVEFVDNLSISDPRFTPGQDVFFKLIVKNTSSVSLTNVTVQDFVPSFIDPVEGPGSFDTSTRIVTFSAGNFAAGEEKTYILKMRVVSQDQIPSDKGLFCLVNRSRASNDQVSSEDTTQLCVEKQVLGVAKVPSAGPELGIALMSLEGLALATGLMLKKSISK